MIPASYRQYSTLIIRIGLGLVFLANSYSAFVLPDELKELINDSFLTGSLPVSLELFVHFIGLSDGIVAALLLTGKGQKYVAFYAFFWLIGVMAVIGIQSPAELLEHFGFLSMTVYLILNSFPK